MGEGQCGYTTRAELGYAYARLLTLASQNGKTFKLHGEPITQTTLARLLGDTYGTPLRYRAMDVGDYRRQRVAELGEFIGNVIAGIYQGIRDGAYDAPSDFALAAGRKHQTWSDYFATQAR